MGGSRAVQFLASVRNEDEARLALAEGADIIDCKEPAAGALGALPYAVVAAIRRTLPAAIPVSATIGDLPCKAEILVPAATEMAATGADFVKAGLFPDGDAGAAIAALGKANLGNSKLVAVLFADLGADFTVLEPLAKAGFAGVLLDTAGKSDGALVDHISGSEIAAFVAAAHANGLFAGLAGSLRLDHVAQLCALSPDILGFRGALCAGSLRKGTLDAMATRSVARALKSCNLAHRSPTPEALAS